MQKHPNSVVAIHGPTGSYSFLPNQTAALAYAEMRRQLGETGDYILSSLDENGKPIGYFEINEFELLLK